MVVPPVAFILAVIRSQSRVPSESGVARRVSSIQRHNLRLVSKIELTDVDEDEELDELSVMGSPVQLAHLESAES
jgi:hypothetical protein